MVTFAVRSGVQIASTYVIKSVSTLIDHVPEEDKKRIIRKRNQLKDKIEIVMYSAEILQLMAARGNSNLSSVLRLVDYLNEDIDDFTQVSAKYINRELNATSDVTLQTSTIKYIEAVMDKLISKVDNIIPVLNLVITTHSNASIRNFQDYFSPGRLLNATTLVEDSNKKYNKAKAETVVGPTFSLTLFDIFYNANTGDGEHASITWREKFTRCDFEVVRQVSKSKEYSYKLTMKENFEDDRYHDYDVKEEEIEYDISLIKKLFFSVSGKLLNLEDRSSPVLVFKMKKSKLVDETDNDESNYHWFAVGDFDPSTDDSDCESLSGSSSDNESNTSDYESIKEKETTENTIQKSSAPLKSKVSPLSLLEYIVRLCNLQSMDQDSILKIKDERLRSFLGDENHQDSSNSDVSKLNKKMNSLKI